MWEKLNAGLRYETQDGHFWLEYFDSREVLNAPRPQEWNGPGWYWCGIKKGIDHQALGWWQFVCNGSEEEAKAVSLMMYKMA